MMDQWQPQLTSRCSQCQPSISSKLLGASDGPPRLLICSICTRSVESLRWLRPPQGHWATAPCQESRDRTWCGSGGWHGGKACASHAWSRCFCLRKASCGAMYWCSGGFPPRKGTARISCRWSWPRSEFSIVFLRWTCGRRLSLYIVFPSGRREAPEPSQGHHRWLL